MIDIADYGNVPHFEQQCLITKHPDLRRRKRPIPDAAQWKIYISSVR